MFRVVSMDKPRTGTFLCYIDDSQAIPSHWLKQGRLAVTDTHGQGIKDNIDLRAKDKMFNCSGV